ncbi:MAG: glycosyltransferase [Firmicutes bacterium]|nr:glycosyltransferase [Bacillota bacterium]
MGQACHITIIRPPGYVHADAFAEVADLLEGGLRRLNVAVTRGENRLPPGMPVILLGAQLLPDPLIARLPPTAIVYNLEQLDPASVWFRRTLAMAATRPVWDYSRENLRRLAGYTPALRVRHVPLGYVPELTRIPVCPDPDIDVLFYGSLNPRRMAVLEALRRNGLRVAQLFGVYGTARDAVIARSKVVLNVHYYPAAIFEFVRVFYLLANRKAVVSEVSAPADLDPDLRGAVRFARYEDLVDAVRELVDHPPARRRREEAGLAVMQARDEAAILRQALALPPGRA